MHVENGGLIVIIMTMRGGASGLTEYVIKCYGWQKPFIFKEQSQPGLYGNGKVMYKFLM